MPDQTQRPTALTPPIAARLLQQAGASHITEATIRADIAAGAPVNDDGTVNLVAYTAWLVRETSRGR